VSEYRARLDLSGGGVASPGSDQRVPVAV
jgi:hypothetical protein